MLSSSFSTHQSGAANGFLSLVPSGRGCLGTEFSVSNGRNGAMQKHPLAVILIIPPLNQPCPRFLVGPSWAVEI